ncbi:MAG TPA: hypothetical protein VMT20_11655 [Terriglobia bacterium]|nr:hypothetical protein [Terriglobia bacterium]
MSVRKPPKRSEAAAAASRANGRKARCPIPEEIVRQVSERAARYPIRLLGLAEMRVLNQDLGAAEKLYRELIAPYSYLPPLLSRNFQDLARQYLELEAWERIRDAGLEHRWARNKIAQMRLEAEVQRDLRGNVKQYLEGGYQSLPDSPAKFQKQFECLESLIIKLEQRDFDLRTLLTYLYGKELTPNTDRAETICLLCQQLMDPALGGGEPLSEDQYQHLLDLAKEEQEEIGRFYGLARDEKMMTRTECMALLGNTREDAWMDRQGERMRQAIDRKQALIVRLLKLYGIQPQPQVAGQSDPLKQPDSARQSDAAITSGGVHQLGTGEEAVAEAESHEQ